MGPLRLQIAVIGWVLPFGKVAEEARAGLTIVPSQQACLCPFSPRLAGYPKDHARHGMLEVR